MVLDGPTGTGQISPRSSLPGPSEGPFVSGRQRPALVPPGPDQTDKGPSQGQGDTPAAQLPCPGQEGPRTHQPGEIRGSGPRPQPQIRKALRGGQRERLLSSRLEPESIFQITSKQRAPSPLSLLSRSRPGASQLPQPHQLCPNRCCLALPSLCLPLSPSGSLCSSSPSACRTFPHRVLVPSSLLSLTLCSRTHSLTPDW